MSDLPRRKEAPLDFFRLRALTLAPVLGLDTREVNEAIGILRTAFGEPWLNYAAEDRSPSIALPLRRHPIGNLITTAGPEQLAEVMELTSYLTYLQDVPGLDVAISALRSDYNETLLQLAFAVRFQHAGASALRLEPPTAGGRFADVSFDLSGQSYLAECYRASGSVGSLQEVELLLNQCMDAIKIHDTVLSVAVALHAMPSSDDRKEIVRVVAEHGEEVVRMGPSADGGFPAFLIRGDLATISVCRGLPVPPGTPPRLVRAPGFPFQGSDHRFFVRLGVGLASQLTSVAPPLNSFTGLGHVALWLPPDEEEKHSIKRDLHEPLERLGRKIEAKLPQTRSATGKKRVLVVNSWLALELERASTSDRLRLNNKILSAHSRVSALLLVCRHWMPPLFRHGFLICQFLPSIDPLPRDFVRRAAAVDRLEPTEGVTA